MVICECADSQKLRLIGEQLEVAIAAALASPIFLIDKRD